MKKLLILLVLLSTIPVGCDATKSTTAADKPKFAENERIRIADEDSDFELIILDPRFNTWLNSYAKPRSFYTKGYLEARNRTWVSEWNNRASQPQLSNVYSMPINYYSTTDYGFEVNYMLYNYLTYFQLSHNQRLGGFVPQI